jgi:hypothetical protein
VLGGYSRKAEMPWRRIETAILRLTVAGYWQTSIERQSVRKSSAYHQFEALHPVDQSVPKSAASASHSAANEDCSPKMPSQEIPFASVLALEDFERFVFVLSVLERYTTLNCATLLGVPVQDIRYARVCALHHLVEIERRAAAPSTDSQMTRKLGAGDECGR